MQQFVHLRLHSEYSIEDSIIRIEDIVKHAKSDNMVALGITDLHNMFGMIKFYKACRKHKLKPILGAEVNVTPLESDINFQQPYKLIMLVKNQAGLRELNELITKSYLHNKLLDIPYIKEEWLLNTDINYQGLIILSGGIYGDIGHAIMQKKEHEIIRNKLERWLKAFPDNYYLELQRVLYPQIDNVIENTLLLAKELSIPVVATHPIQFKTAKGYIAHEVRTCIASSERLDDAARKTKFTQDQYFLSQQEMVELFSDIPSAITNTLQIVKKCNLELQLGKPSLPDFAIEEGNTINEYLTVVANKGLKERMQEMQQYLDYRNVNCQLYQERLDTEIITIVNMGFAGYFLIVADFINWAKLSCIPVGPGRGSGVGSLVAFALKITDVDPIRYGLLFERFLNPERVSMPDFDIDFCQDKRELVIEYVKNKYSQEQVAQIATFGTMSSKAVIKDVGRVLGLPYGLCDSISKLIINTPAKSYSLTDAVTKFPDLAAKLNENDEDVKRLWELSLQLEDLTRNVGKHAAGVLIAPSKLTDFCPLYVADGMQTSQLDKDDVEAVGLVKFDFLGLRNLTIIQDTINDIYDQTKQKITLSNYEFTDKAVYKLLQEGNTSAIFQLESAGIRRILTKLAPDRFEDIMVLIALYRPGPLGSGMVDDFIRRKKGLEKPEYFHDDLQQCLESTYGIIVYQEQVMQISQIIGGYTLGNADLLRRAMGKKKPEEMAQHKNTFIAGAKERGYDIKLAENLFDLMAKFAEYGFNKSHSAAYAVISYHTAFLKANYKSHFMAATLSSELDRTDKIFEFYQDCLANNLIIKSPDINKAKYKFYAIDATTIYYALGAIKGIGKQAVDLIIKEREANGDFKNFVDFCLRVDKKVINKKTLESLVKAGVFDLLETNRALLYNNIAFMLNQVNAISLRKNSNQASLFDDIDCDVMNIDYNEVKLEPCDPWGLKEQLHMEKQALGYYFSANLFDEYKKIVQKLAIDPLNKYTSDSEEFAILLNNNNTDNKWKQSNVVVCGIISKIGTKPLKRGGKIMFVQMADATANLEFVIFSEEVEKYKNLLKLDEFICVEGDLMYDSYKEQIKLTGKKILTLDEMLQMYVKKVSLNLGHSNDTQQVNNLKEIFTQDNGVEVNISYTNELASCKLDLTTKNKIIINYENLSLINTTLGECAWSLN